MACLLNRLSHNQQQVIRYIIELLISKGPVEPVMDVLSQTSFMADLAVISEVSSTENSSIDGDSDYREDELSTRGD
ncbi:hypothetical protein VNI00_017210 [Paramarasmius palmivorus]|uniref:Uncharacterized protein n=1 Tax=Paramarasmius palmivorus TaxID=297713 RepID=A0AAW0B7E0_9AGAR